MFEFTQKKLSAIDKDKCSKVRYLLSEENNLIKNHGLTKRESAILSTLMQ